MDDQAVREVRDFWDRVAADWEIQVGDDGDVNRRLNSDPVLWRFAGDIVGRDVLDAGCGTGYLSRKLAREGARVVGVDLSPKMVDLARAKAPEIEFHVDSIAELRTVARESVDVVVSNYVLMDLVDLDDAARAFHRVLRPEGIAALVFSHPCFPQGRRSEEQNGAVSYAWDFPYFEQRRCVDPPWGHFDFEFVWFHRPLSDYWKSFKSAGFVVDDFEEPRLDSAHRHIAVSSREAEKCMTRPYSVAFKLVKPAG
jgi:SAM-dependent methyltransferase